MQVFRSPIIGNTRLLRLMRRLVFFFWACGAMLRGGFDVLHLNSTGAIGPFSAAVSSRILALLAKCRGAHTVIVHSLADSPQAAFETTGWRGFWRKILFSGFNSIVAVSPALRDGLKTHFRDRVILVTNAVRDDLFKPSIEARQSRRVQGGIKDGDIVFVFLGTVCKRKGFDLLAKAFGELAKERGNWHLWVIGPCTRQHSQSVDEKEVAEISAPLGPLLNRVTFLGRIDDRSTISELLSAADLFVFPTRKEGMPISPLEAMSAGLPQIITRIPGVTDLANVEGATGHYIAQDDLEALKSSMLRLGSDHHLRKRMGEEAIEVIRKSFGWRRHLEQWANVYRHMPIMAASPESLSEIAKNP
jgi:glycosyltransferase involved in cell wall biosynthesis